MHPLSVGAVHRIVHRLLGAPLSRPRLVRLHAVSGGNPFHAIELARVAGVSDANGIALEVPDSLADVVRARLAPLSADTRRLLVAVAAAGDVRPDLLARLGTESALDEAVDHGILVLVDGRVRLSHPLLGSTITADAGALVRSRVHRQLADLAVAPEERARHLALAGSGPDERVAAALGRAAESACRRGARGAGAALYEQSAALTPAATRGPRRAAPGRGARALPGRRAGRRPGAARAGRSRRDPGRFEAHCALGTLLDETIGGNASFAAFDAALGTDDPAIECEAHRGLAQSLAYVGDLEQAVRHADAAVAAAEPLAEPVRLVYALAMQAFVRRFSGYAAWWEPLARGLVIEASVELPTLDACPSAVDADLRRIGFELAEARAAYEGILGRSTGGATSDRGWCRFGLATVARLAGAPISRGHAQELADLAEQTALLRLPAFRACAHLSRSRRGDRAGALLDTALDEAASAASSTTFAAPGRSKASSSCHLGTPPPRLWHSRMHGRSPKGGGARPGHADVPRRRSRGPRLLRGDGPGGAGAPPVR